MVGCEIQHEQRDVVSCQYIMMNPGHNGGSTQHQSLFSDAGPSGYDPVQWPPPGLAWMDKH
jgi:hypothetical protein